MKRGNSLMKPTSSKAAFGTLFSLPLYTELPSLTLNSKVPFGFYSIIAPVTGPMALCLHDGGRGRLGASLK